MFMYSGDVTQEGVSFDVSEDVIDNEALGGWEVIPFVSTNSEWGT
jgi:hypothetical protein